MRFCSIFAIACSLILILGLFTEANAQCQNGACQKQGRLVIPRRVIEVPVEVAVVPTVPNACAPTPPACAPPSACEPAGQLKDRRFGKLLPNRRHLLPRFR